MNRITTARLDELIADYDWRLTLYETPFMVDVRDSLRELRAYRKAVKEWIEAVDRLKLPLPPLAAKASRKACEEAEVTLRALKERT